MTEPEFNLGGGMAVENTRPDAVFDWPDYGRGLAGLTRPGETLRIEPGRAVTAYCGWYLTRVLDVKHSHGEAFAVVAGGTHHLRTPGTGGPAPGGARGRVRAAGGGRGAVARLNCLRILMMVAPG